MKLPRLDYKNMFTNFEDRELKAAEEGFSVGTFANMIHYLEETHGQQFASYWSSLNKADKREFCANIIVDYSDNQKLVEKARKYLKKRFKEQLRREKKKNGKKC